MVVRNLWRRPTRTALTVLGIAVGVAAVVALSAFGEGMVHGFGAIVAVDRADLTLGQKDSLMMVYSSIDESVGVELRQMEGVAQVAGAVVGFVQMRDAPYFVVLGEDPRGFAIGRFTLTAGGPLTGRYQMLLGQIAARNFHKAVGDTFRLNGVGYRIVGVYATGVSLEDGGAVIPLEDAQRAFTTRDKVTYFALRVRDPAQIDSVKAAVEARWPSLAATRTGEATRQDDFLQIYRAFGLFVGVFAALVGGLGMMNTMLMSVLERTREIGVLRALGWRRRRVLGLILAEALVLSAVGSLAGVGLGLGLIRLAQATPAVEALLEGTLTPLMVLQAVLIAVLLGLVGGLYPTWRAARLTPLEAMRAEGGASAAARRPPLPFARQLWRQPGRSLLTVASLGLGTGFIVAILGMIAGVNLKFTQLASAGQADLVAEQANASDISFSEIDERVATRLRAEPEVAGVARVLLAFPSTAESPVFFLFGLDPQETYIQHYRVREGRLPTRSGEIALGRFGANSLEKTLGDTVHLSNTTFRVVGIYENASSYEDSGGLVLLKDAQRMLNKPRKVTLLGIQLTEAARADAEAVARRLEAAYPELMVTRAEGFTQRAQDFQTLNAIWAALITVTVIVGGIVMTNAMLMSVFERTQEIGVLRALGWRRRRILGQILAESLTLSLASAVLGIAIGMGLNSLVGYVPLYGPMLTPVYSPAVLGQTALLAVALGALGGLYPAWRAANLPPVEALRYE